MSRDVVGIDLNMGCPKHFSVHAGMGSALLDKPETVSDVLLYFSHVGLELIQIYVKGRILD